MSDDMLLHFSSNSSNQSDHSLPTKIAKLEARMVGKAPAHQHQQNQQTLQTTWSSVSPQPPRSVASEDLVHHSTSSDSDDDNGGEFLIQANTQKRQKLQEEDSSSIFEHVEAVADGRQKTTEPSEAKAGTDVNRKKKHSRGRGHSVSGRGRSARANEQTKSQMCASTVSPSNGQLENSYYKYAKLKRKMDIDREWKDGFSAINVYPRLNENLIDPKERNDIEDGINCVGWVCDCGMLVELKVVEDMKRKMILLDNKPKEQFQTENRSSLEEEVTSLRAKVAALEEDLHKSRREASDYHNLCRQLEKELKDLKDCEQQLKPKRTKVISDLLISVSKAERQEARLKVRQDSVRLGNVGVIRAGTVISETWEDGQALKDLNAHLRQLLETKEAVERQRKSLKKRQSDKGDGNDTESGIQEEDLFIQDEIYKSRLASIKREEEVILRERDRYELEKGRLIREMKRLRDEDGSRFNNFQILNHRYALLNLLGKGGFSEVYKAYDLVEHRYVACKLHGLNAQWSEDKKQSYIRHAIREYNIHKTLVHHHIVRLWDTFEIDQNTFCTVLEYCSGKDLDAVLKATPVLPEREARIVIVQIFQGLVYLNKRTQKIIHYDLKPGNVLFDEFGVAKVTDFGLSKIVEDDVGSQGMELTSQGAGTYWYLPPECFELSKIPLISSKVDVWSAGILFYQMLFGRRPFGHDQSQERILREDTIIKARKVEFPSRPAVSNEGKELIRKCLTYNQAERPDVLTIAQDPYLTYSKK
ncbi:hypothetical protein JRO89_XS10G0194900 [Xanthoceras sorbifolium]|uniref:Protein kinase domain-containing protein n=1 Tax=Xanthoceras sorbifolium TaxID=99658 RepID=A0ABQ8HJG8_9ROSI|nr:hypothetical protein JRO89_XS10G0194900 [Xanthoceras sorbifolium]